MRQYIAKGHFESVQSPEGAKGAVVFIHGILGGPAHFDFLAHEAFSCGFAVYNLLLPGHGMGSRSFARSGLAAWRGHVREAVTEACERFSLVLLAGHSMGCLLAMQACLEGAACRGIFAIAPPLHVHLRRRGAVNGLRVAFHRVREDNAWEAAARDACSIQIQNPLACAGWLPRYADLFRLIHQTCQGLEGLRVPIWAVHCGRDELVSPKSAGIMAARLRDYRALKVPGAGHFYYPAEEKEAMRRFFLAFLEENAALGCN